MNTEDPKYQQKSRSISSPEQNYFALFAMRYPVIDNIFIERLGLSTKKNPKNKSACVQVKTCRVNNFFLLINLA